MNKRTRAIDEDTYKLIIATMKNGFTNEQFEADKGTKPETAINDGGFKRKYVGHKEK